jgi:hypothetical protein
MLRDFKGWKQGRTFWDWLFPFPMHMMCSHLQRFAYNLQFNSPQTLYPSVHSLKLLLQPMQVNWSTVICLGCNLKNF